MGQRDKALEYLRQALPIHEEVSDKYGESITRYNMATVYQAGGRLTEAVAQLRQAVELMQQVQSPHLKTAVDYLAQVEEELKAKGAG